MVDSLRSIKLGDAKCSISARGQFKDEDAKGYAPNPESDQLQVHLPLFDGPFDLLLHLIQKHSLDIFDIPISLITEKYLEEIQSLELDLAGDFLLMAATLIQIKSKMLLPKEEQPEELLEDEGVDPRADLVRRLLEYQRYKEVANQLALKDTLGFSVFGRKYEEIEFLPVEDDRELAPIQAFELIENFARIMEVLQPKVGHTVALESISLRARLSEMIEFSRMKLNYFFQDALAYFGVSNRTDLIVTFLAILEMAKLKLVEIEQEPGSSKIALTNVKDDFDGDLEDVEF